MERSAWFVVPGRIDTATGGYVYDRKVVNGLRALGWAIEVRELDDSFLEPSREALEAADTALAALPDDAIVIIDGLAFGAMPDAVDRHAGRLRLVALVHLPHSLDVKLAPDVRRRREACERAALRRASLVVVTGSSSVVSVAAYGVGPDRILLVEPGADAAPPAPGSDDDRVRVLCVATVNAIKGHEILVRSLDRIRHLPWQLTCAGSLTRDSGAVDRLERLLAATSLGDRVRLVGALNDADLERCYQRADLFALATRFETYGMAVAEALAHALPVVSTRTGAIPDLVGSDAGLLAPPDDENAFGEALRRAVGDRHLRRRLREGALCARNRLKPWESAARTFADALTKMGSHG